MLGEWKLISSENFEDVMKALGVGLVLRKLGASQKPNVKFEKNGDEWTFSTISAIRTIVIKFKLDEEFDEETADGRKVKVIHLKNVYFSYRKLLANKLWVITFRTDP
jgi:fatty acid-binding protein 3